jgi:hypothetical protein
MPNVGSTSKPAYVYDAGTDTWIPIGPGEHTHSYIPNTLVDAKGDILTASADNTPAILSLGNSGESIVADSSTSTGLRYTENYAAGKNKVINGDMLIDQRNAGAAVTVDTSSSFLFAVDRFSGIGELTDGVFTLQQDSDAPAGFLKSVKATVTTADASIGASQTYNFRTQLEGQSIGDLNWGTANAKTVTLSFYVRSSVTGTFGGAIRNSALNRSYPYTYTINAANTWERKSITIPGDTSGTWLTTNGTGIRIMWSLGSGSNFLGTAGAWAGANYIGATGETSLISTLNATWYITGVQFEVGSVATAFQTATGTIQGELAACQRYYFRRSGGSLQMVANSAVAYNSTTSSAYIQPPQVMRTTPTSFDAANIGYVQYDEAGPYPLSSLVLNGTRSTESLINIYGTVSGVTAGRFGSWAGTAAGAYLGFSAEL